MNAAHVDLARALGLSLATWTNEDAVRQEARRALAGSRLTDTQKESVARLYRATLHSIKTPRKRE